MVNKREGGTEGGDRPKDRRTDTTTPGGERPLDPGASGTSNTGIVGPGKDKAGTPSEPSTAGSQTETAGGTQTRNPGEYDTTLTDRDKADLDRLIAGQNTASPLRRGRAAFERAKARLEAIGEQWTGDLNSGVVGIDRIDDRDPGTLRARLSPTEMAVQTAHNVVRDLKIGALEAVVAAGNADITVVTTPHQLDKTAIKGLGDGVNTAFDVAGDVMADELHKYGIALRYAPGKTIGQTALAGASLAGLVVGVVGFNSLNSKPEVTGPPPAAASLSTLFPGPDQALSPKIHGDWATFTGTPIGDIESQAYVSPMENLEVHGRTPRRTAWNKAQDSADATIPMAAVRNSSVHVPVVSRDGIAEGPEIWVRHVPGSPDPHDIQQALVPDGNLFPPKLEN